MILKSYKYRIYPTQQQKDLLEVHFNGCRFVYNLALETKQIAYTSAGVNLTAFDLMRQLTDLKQHCIWLKQIGIHSLQQSILNLDTAFVNFFRGDSKYPNFKSKKQCKKSFIVPSYIKIKDGKICFSKFQKGIKLNQHRSFDGEIKRATFSKTNTGKYFVSILVKTPQEVPEKSKVALETSIGVDLGLTHYLITSKGQKVDNPRFLRKAQDKLKFTQRKWSKHKSKRTKHKLAILHEKVANQRRDFLQKLSTQLIRENQTIALETLKVKNMVKNHKLALSINDAAWYTFTEMLTYKGEWYGNNILRIDTFTPTTKLCSNCGSRNDELTLSVRSWECKVCRTQHDRDINAAKNILQFATMKMCEGLTHKNHGELPTLVGVKIREADNP